MEHLLYKPVNFLILPLFALANTAILLPGEILTAWHFPISTGIVTGLVLGKPSGKFLFSFLAAKAGFATLPSQTTYKQLWGIGMLGGIGFTMSIFTTSLAYPDLGMEVISKVSVIAASVLASVAGYCFLAGAKTATKTRLAAHQDTSTFDYEPQPAIA